MGDRFVSESEIEEAKRRRQEEWDRVRKADDPKEAPEAPVDNRCLYDRLKEQRDKKELDEKEARAFKNMVRGLDSDETAFLDLVDEVKSKEGRRLAAEEEELLAKVREARGSAADLPTPSAPVAPPPKPSGAASSSSSAPKRHSSLLSAAVRPKAAKTAEVELPTRPTATTKIGALPGMASYATTSDDDSDSDSDSELEATKTYPMNLPENQPGAQQKQSSGPKKQTSQQSSC